MTNYKYLRTLFIGVIIALLAHMLIVWSCAWWWEVYKLNVNWNLHEGRPVPSPFFLFYAPSWFWVDLVISVITFSSFAMLVTLIALLAKALGITKGGFIVAVALYHVLLLANWVWYEIFRANIRSSERINPSPELFRYIMWGDILYAMTNIVGFLAIAVFISRVALPRIEVGGEAYG